MAEPQNLANAAVIIGAILFMFKIGFPLIILAILSTLLLIFGIITWAHWYQTEDQKELIKLGIRQTEANIQNLNAATAIAIANTKLIARNLGQ